MNPKTVIYSQKQKSYNQHQNNIYTKGNSYIPNYHQPTPMTKKSSTMKKFQHCIISNTSQTIKNTKQNHYNFINQNNQILSHNLLLSTNNNPNPNPNQNNKNSPYVTKPKKPTQKPIKENYAIDNIKAQYDKIMKNLTHYWQYYQLQLAKQIQKHEKYYNQIIKLIQQQKKQSKKYLYKQIAQLKTIIEVKKGALQNKIAQLEKNNYKSIQKEKEELETQKLFNIPLFQINIQKIADNSHIKAIIHNYFNFNVVEFQQSKAPSSYFEKEVSVQSEQMQSQSNLLYSKNQPHSNHHQQHLSKKQELEKYQKQSIADTIQLEQSTKTLCKQTRTQKDYFETDSNFQQQLNQMTPIHTINPLNALNLQDLNNQINLDPKPKNMNIKTHPLNNKLQHLAINLNTKLQDQDLYCDQSIENILKENKIVRKKVYQCKQAPIPQESESHQDSFVASVNEQYT